MEIKKGPKYDEITEALKETDGFCPCKMERTADTKCICKEFREQINKGEPCVCHCQRYKIEK
jgi:hypothetical protein